MNVPLAIVCVCIGQVDIAQHERIRQIAVYVVRSVPKIDKLLPAGCFFSKMFKVNDDRDDALSAFGYIIGRTHLSTAL